MENKVGVKLGVNIDHVATLRQQRDTKYPEPVAAAVLAEFAGADGITVHLREDRRHIQDRDVQILKKVLQVPMNLEMAATDEMVGIACEILPEQVTLVPEKREERTTEGGLNVSGQKSHLSDKIARMKDAGIRVSLFVEPERDVLMSSAEVGAGVVELHTGKYADALNEEQERRELERLIKAGADCLELGLVLNAGHGLHYRNTHPVAEIDGMNELNIGHSIIARAVLVGLEQAVREMKDVIAMAGQ